MQVLHRPSELAAETGQVESSQNHFSGNATNQDLSSVSACLRFDS